MLDSNEQAGNPDAVSGSVALLFTDVAGSTKGWETHGAEYGVSLRRHFDLLSGAVESCGGTVFKTVGDQVCAVFPRVGDAVLAAIASQRKLAAERWPDPVGPIRVRMAVHSGEPQYRGGDYFGSPVNRVARLVDAAHPGQILLSAAAQAGMSAAGTDFAVKPLGVHMLKDLLNPEAIFQVLTPELESEFPPPRTLDARPHNLPSQLTSFVGRSDELAELASRLDDPETRLVTLIGPPGVGKTRLAMQFAAEYAYRYPDGVWLVELAALRDPAGIAHQIAASLSIGHEDNLSAEDRLRDALAQRRLLIVCDNFEHVIAGADVIAGLLRSAPNVQVLATSRSLLRVSGETAIEVPPLEAPDEGALKLSDLAGCPATVLFVERATVARPGWEPTQTEAGDLAYICRELDGLPLAIELAAARMRSMSVRDIRLRLSDRFRLLSSGRIDLPERQRTLRAALDWSYDLMTPAERETLAQLSVFRGGFTLEAAEAVCDSGDVWDIVPALHDQSFLVARERGGGMRYDLLEVVREYAAERMVHPDRRRRAHAEFFLPVAETAVNALDTREDADACRRLEADIDNLRSALSWACSNGEAEMCARFTVALAEYFNRRGWWMERIERLESAIALGRTAIEEKPIMAWLHYHYANALADLGRLDEAGESAMESLRRAESLSDRRLNAWTLILLGFLAEKQGQASSAEDHYVRAASVVRGTSDAFSLASALTNQARLADMAGDSERAVEILQQTLGLWREVGSARGLATALTNLGCISDEVEGARAEAEGRADVAHERREQAIALFVEALGLQLRLQNRPKIALLLNNIGEALERDGRPVPAIRLYTASESMFRQAGSPKAAYVAQQLARVRGAAAFGASAVGNEGDPMDIANETAAWRVSGKNGDVNDMITSSNMA